jgi:acyl-CoA synthetase (AMP-forming)/AMP-acid ligase II
VEQVTDRPLRPASPAGPPGSELATIIRRHATDRPDSVFLSSGDGERTITWGELESGIGTVVRDLQVGGAAPGSVVLTQVADPLAFAVTYLGILAAGRRCAPIDPSAPPAEADRITAVVDAGFRLTGSGAFERRIRDGAVGHAATVTGGGVVLSTSGSTGAPKAVGLTEGQLLHAARSVASHNRLTPGDRGYNPLPLFHINGQVVALLASVVSGAELVLDQRFSRTRFWERMDGLRVTWINAVPAIIAVLLTEPIQAVPSLRFLRSASAPLPPDHARRLRGQLGVPVIESYGMTEAASQITATGFDAPAPAGSAGHPIEVRLEIRRPNGAEAGSGELGRVWIRGRSVISAYLNGSNADRFDADGWLDTGDLGSIDGTGALYLAGRSDDVINRGGELVYPREVEEVLLGDPRVTEAVVVGRPDDVLGYVPVAFVQSEMPDGRLVADLVERCASQLSRFKCPVAIEVVAALPRAANGKVRRHEVRSGDAVRAGG